MKPMHKLPADTRISAAQAVAPSNSIRNFYMLLSMTLLLPAVIIASSVAIKLPFSGLFALLSVYFGLLFLTARTLKKDGLFFNRNK